MTIGQRIKERREELGMSQIELANKMGLSAKSTICKLETQGDNITTDRIRRVADALNCSVSYLMGWDIELNKPNYDPDVILSYGAKIGEMVKDNELMRYANKISALPYDKQKQIYAYIDFIVSQTPLETLV